MKKKNCQNCANYWKDYSADCNNCAAEDELSEEEIEKYFTNLENGCPYFEEATY